MPKKKKKQKLQNKSNLVTKINPKSPISEQYRIIRTNIQFSVVDKDLKTLACTSSMPEEGKSTTISNLAVTLAQQGQKILLVDADLRKPTIHQIMKVKNRHGLTTLLTKKALPDEAIKQAPDVDNLYILTSGFIPPNPSELLGSKMMEELISTFSEQFDLILFDTPPVLAVTDAQILSNRCDGVVLVIKSNQTEKKDLVKAKDLLDRSQCNVLGIILNAVDQKDANYYNYYRAENE